jgi:hypothetical protein
MWAQQEQRSPARIVSGAGSLKSPGKRGGTDFSPRPRQRACQDPLTRQGGDALTTSISHRQPLCYRSTRQDLLIYLHPNYLPLLPYQCSDNHQHNN